MKIFTFWKKTALILALFLPLSYSSLAQCVHTLEMFDSWGDGWNGASVTVFVNGTAVLSNQTIATGYSSTATFTASTGDAITTTWSSGSYDNECTYNILDGNNVVIGSDGPSPTGISTPISASCPSCPEPSNLTATNLGFTSAEISWTTGGATNWNIEYGPAGFTPGTGTVVHNVTNPYTITPLTHNTAYDVYVQDSCGPGDLSSWSGPLNFQTPYDLQCTTGTQTVIFTENWETGVGLWTGDIGTANGEWQIRTGTTGSLNTGPSGAHEGSQYIYFESSGAGSGGSASMVSPPIDLSGGNGSALLSFWAHGYGGDIVGASLTIGVSNSPTGSFTTVFTDTFTTQLQSAEADPYIQYFINLDAYLGQTIYLEFHYNNPGSYESDFAIDLIEVISCVTCPAPSNLMASSSPAGTSADLDWTTGGSTVWNIEYGPTGFVKGTGTVEAVTTKPHTIFGLTVATDYDFYVQDSCGVGDLSSWVGPQTFTTNAPPLNGVYTIGDTTGGAVYDFPSFSSAAKYLSIGGVSGQVTFNVASGVYNEQVFVDTIIGASPTNTVTFQAATGNAADVELTYESTTSADNYTLCLEGAKYLRLKHLTLSATGVSYARVIELRDSANYNLIDSCILNGLNNNYTSTNYAVIYKTSSTGHAEYNIISNNQINNGSYGVYYYGSGTTSLSSGILIENNNLVDPYYYGIRLYYLDAPVVNKNSVVSNTAYTSFYGIYAGYCDNALEITNNAVEHSQSGYGLYLYYCDGTALEPGLIANNMISYYDGTSTLYGIYHYYSNYQNYYHNTVNVEGTSTSTRAMYVLTSSSYTDLTLTNNILSNSGNTGYAIYFNSTAMTNVASDYNLFYAANATGLGYYGGAQADLTAWQTATTFDANSVEDNPVFANIYMNLLTPLSNAVDNLGTPIAGITTDIYDNPRSATTPDIGAVEFTGFSDDIALTNVSIDNGRCLSTNDSVFVTVANSLGSAVDFSVNNLRIVWDVTGPVNSTDTILISSGNLTIGHDTLFARNGVDLSVPGTYYVSAYIEANAVNLSQANDTLLNYYMHVIHNPFVVSPEYDTLYNPEDTAKLTVYSSYFEAGDFLITEICQYASTLTGQPVGGKPAYLGDDYIEITGAPNTDLGGFTFEKWTSSGSAPNVSHTFPMGTYLNAQGTYLLSTYQGTTSLVDYHQVADITASYSSSNNCLNVIRNQMGDVVDAVLYGTGSTIPAAAGITTEWTGAGIDGSSSWGIRLTGPDTDDNTNWIKATQDPNVLNTGVTNPTAPTQVGFSWSYNGSVTSTQPDTVVGPYTANGTYVYAAAFTDTACGLQADTAFIHVAMPMATTSMTAQSVCIGDSLELFVDLTGTAPWTLIVTDGTGNDTIPGITTTPYGIWVYPTAQTTTYKAVKVFDAKGWNYSNDSIVVTLDSLPTAEYSYAVSNVTATFAEVDFTDISVNADSVKYDFGDGITSTQTNPTHNYTSNGTFNAYQVAYNQCGTDTFWLDVIVSGVSIEDFNTNYQVDVYPNPNNGRFTTDIYVDNTEKAALHILTMEGRKVYAEDLGTFNGRKTINIDIDLPKGVYFVQVQMLHGNIVRKLIIQ
jgi:parallel beta-helix repeat protein